jgi:hypothetical protein
MTTRHPLSFLTCAILLLSAPAAIAQTVGNSETVGAGPSVGNAGNTFGASPGGIGSQQPGVPSSINNPIGTSGLAIGTQPSSSSTFNTGPNFNTGSDLGATPTFGGSNLSPSGNGFSNGLSGQQAGQSGGVGTLGPNSSSGSLGFGGASTPGNTGTGSTGSGFDNTSINGGSP